MMFNRPLNYLMYFWLSLFVIFPIIKLIIVSFSEASLSCPPYTALFKIDSLYLNMRISFQNYLNLFSDKVFFKSLCNSILLACLVSFLCFIIALPAAYYISKINDKRKNYFIMLCVAPSIIVFVVRIYIWVETFTIYDRFCDAYNINFDSKLMKVVISMVHSYFPFMFMPIYSVLEKIPRSLIESAYDLGASPWSMFIKIIFPLVRRGLVNGVIFVMVPMMSDFIMPTLFSEGSFLMIGNIIWMELFSNRDWPYASSIVVFMLFLILPVLWVINKENKLEKL